MWQVIHESQAHSTELIQMQQHLEAEEHSEQEREQNSRRNRRS